MESNSIAVLIAVLLVAGVGAFVIVQSTNSTGMAINANPYKCESWGGYWYQMYGCAITPKLCANAGGTWRDVNRQCVGYDEKELCQMTGATWDDYSESCRY